MGLLSKLIGRKAETAANLAAEIENRRQALAVAQARGVAATTARATALDDFDADGIARADAEAAAAGIAAEVETRALDVLTMAHAEAVEAERRRDQARAAAELTAEGKAIAAEFGAEWDRAAAVLARLRHRAASFNLKIANAEYHGEIAPGAVPAAEAFRGAVRFAESMPRIVDLSGETLWPAPLPVSDRERDRAAIDAEQAKRRAERDVKRAAEAKARDEERAAERQAERDAAAERERNRYYPGSWREHLNTDAAK